MKLQVISDLHIEHGQPFAFKKAEGAEVLILAGDIGSYDSALPLIKSCAAVIPTIMILGNHEPMGYTIEETVAFWESVSIDNFYFLNNRTVELNGVHFIGSTLWSDLNASPMNQAALINAVADFKKIISKDKVSYITVEELQFEYEKNKAFIEKELNKDYPKKVLITHHLPTFSSVSEKWVGSILNTSFASNLDNLLMYSEGLKLCIHGHTHDNFDYYLGDTLHIVCNPRGYPWQENGFDPLKIVEV